MDTLIITTAILFKKDTWDGGWRMDAQDYTGEIIFKQTIKDVLYVFSAEFDNGWIKSMTRLEPKINNNENESD